MGINFCYDVCCDSEWFSSIQEQQDTAIRWCHCDDFTADIIDLLFLLVDGRVEASLLCACECVYELHW